MADKPWLYDRFLKLAKKLVDNKERVASLVDEAGKKAGGKQAILGQAWGTLTAFFRLIKAWSKGEYRDVSTKTIIMVLASILYFANPLDAIPDFLPLLGFGDDAVFILYILSQVKDEIERFLDWEDSLAQEAEPKVLNG